MDGNLKRLQKRKSNEIFKVLSKRLSTETSGIVNEISTANESNIGKRNDQEEIPVCTNTDTLPHTDNFLSDLVSTTGNVLKEEGSKI